MPARQLRPVIERVYRLAVASFKNEADELVDGAATYLSDATVVCPELLARLADDRIAPWPRRAQVYLRWVGLLKVGPAQVSIWPSPSLVVARRRSSTKPCASTAALSSSVSTVTAKAAARREPQTSEPRCVSGARWGTLHSL